MKTFAQYLEEKQLGKPFRTPGGPKKFAVYVKNPESGNVKKVTFGDPNLSIKRDSPERRKAFRARHNCDDPGPRTKARYWSCRQWRAGAKVEAQMDTLVEQMKKVLAETFALYLKAQNYHWNVS